MSALFRVGHAGRMQELATVRRTERAIAVRHHIHQQRALLTTAPLSTFKSFRAIDTFLEHFRRAERRRPILVIVGPTRTGK